MNLQTHLQKRHEAIRTVRETRDARTRQKAWDAATDASDAIMAELIDREEARAADESMAAAEAREHAVGRLMTTTSTPDMRSLVEPIDPTGTLVRRISVPLPEMRTEYPLLGSDTGSQSYGGYAVGTRIGNPVVALVNESAVLQAQPLVIRTRGGEPMDIPLVESGNLPSAAYRAEGVEATETDAILTKTELKTQNISGFLEVSEEFLSDAQIADASGFVMDLCGKALGMKLGAELALGSGGASAITGVFYNPTTGVTAAGSTPSVDELVALRASVSPANRRGARWLLSDAAASNFLHFKDDTGQYLLQPDIGAGAFARLWGDPVVVDPYGPALSSGLLPVVYGRFDQGYVVRFAGDLQIEATDAFHYTSWLRTFRFQVRVGAGYLDPLAIKAIELP